MALKKVVRKAEEEKVVKSAPTKKTIKKKSTTPEKISTYQFNEEDIEGLEGMLGVDEDTQGNEDVKEHEVHEGDVGHKDTKRSIKSTTKKTTTTTSTKKSSKRTTEYEPEVVREFQTKDNGKGYKESLEISVKRFGEDGIPYVHFSTKVDSEVYTGYAKGKHVSFPLELLYEFMSLIKEVDKECDSKNIE